MNTPIEPTPSNQPSSAKRKPAFFSKFLLLLPVVAVLFAFNVFSTEDNRLEDKHPEDFEEEEPVPMMSLAERIERQRTVKSRVESTLRAVREKAAEPRERMCPAGLIQWERGEGASMCVRSCQVSAQCAPDERCVAVEYRATKALPVVVNQRAATMAERPQRGRRICDPFWADGLVERGEEEVRDVVGGGVR